MPVNKSDDVAVTLLKLHGSDHGGMIEAGKSVLHYSTLLDTKQAVKTARYAGSGKFRLICPYGIQEAKFLNP